MTDCSTDQKRMIPLYKIVNSAIVDMYEDIGKTQQRYSFWAARGLKKLNREVLKTGKRYVTLTVNRNTNTATLPPDFYEEIFVGVINEQGIKIPLKSRNDLVDSKNIEDIPCIDKCEKCNQDTAICNDMTITESTVLVTINNSIYEQTVIKKLYPNGDYYLETRIPVWDVIAESVVYTTNKEFITAIDLKPCGCIDDTEENIEKIRCCCPDVYNCYFASCDNNCIVDYGGYRIFEETGLIQVDRIGTFTKLYLEYRGFMPKKNGQYQVPEVAFETLVEWVKFMAVDGRKNVSNPDKRWRWDRYRTERSNMEKELGRINLSQIIQAIGLTPKFDIDHPVCDPYLSTVASTVSSSSSSSASSGDDCSLLANTGGSPCSLCPPNNSTFVPFDIAEIAGVAAGPTIGTNIYQNNKLIGAIGINSIIVDNTNETIKALQFVIDTVNGIITRYQADGVTPNDWQAGNVLIVPTFFKLI